MSVQPQKIVLCKLKKEKIKEKIIIIMKMTTEMKMMMKKKKRKRKNIKIMRKDNSIEISRITMMKNIRIEC